MSLIQLKTTFTDQFGFSRNLGGLDALNDLGDLDALDDQDDL